jgi:hypothetical protein
VANHLAVPVNVHVLSEVVHIVGGAVNRVIVRLFRELAVLCLSVLDHAGFRTVDNLGLGQNSQNSCSQAVVPVLLMQLAPSLQNEERLDPVAPKFTLSTENNLFHSPADLPIYRGGAIPTVSSPKSLKLRLMLFTAT